MINSNWGKFIIDIWSPSVPSFPWYTFTLSYTTGFDLNVDNFLHSQRLWQCLFQAFLQFSPMKWTLLSGWEILKCTVVCCVHMFDPRSKSIMLILNHLGPRRIPEGLLHRPPRGNHPCSLHCHSQMHCAGYCILYTALDTGYSRKCVLSNALGTSHSQMHCTGDWLLLYCIGYWALEMHYCALHLIQCTSYRQVISVARWHRNVLYHDTQQCSLQCGSEVVARANHLVIRLQEWDMSTSLRTHIVYICV